ncbi:hypothetical protein BGX27_004253 [Mortierella sp. AM989]|nr:hypothetical protein BGX27_004253 [Mortierella sp. AM989]
MLQSLALEINTELSTSSHAPFVPPKLKPHIFSNDEVPPETLIFFGGSQLNCRYEACSNFVDWHRHTISRKLCRQLKLSRAKQFVPSELLPAIDQELQLLTSDLLRHNIYHNDRMLQQSQLPLPSHASRNPNFRIHADAIKIDPTWLLFGTDTTSTYAFMDYFMTVVKSTIPDNLFEKVAHRYLILLINDYSKAREFLLSIDAAEAKGDTLPWTFFEDEFFRICTSDSEKMGASAVFASTSHRCGETLLDFAGRIRRMARQLKVVFGTRMTLGNLVPTAPILKIQY